MCKCSGPGFCHWHKTVTTKEEFVACQKGNTPRSSSPSPCMHLGGETKHEGQFDCSVHGVCTLHPGDLPIAACGECSSNCSLDATPEEIREKWQDPLKILNRYGTVSNGLRNVLTDGAAFLVCGGPSVNELDHSRLQERGVWSLGINNIAGHVRTNAFLCGDPPSKFHNGIWRDPSVMKFVPSPKLRRRRGRVRKKEGDEFLPDGDVLDCPNVWGFERRSWLSPDSSWFTVPGAPWGNHNKGVKRTGEPKTVATMLMGIRLLQYLGARKIFLLGADFYFDSKRDDKERYAFAQKRDEGAVLSNNSQLKIVAKWLRLLRPHFERFGFEVFNCNQMSHLDAFDYCPFDTAVKVVKGDNFPEEPFDLENWYDK